MAEFKKIITSPTGMAVIATEVRKNSLVTVYDKDGIIGCCIYTNKRWNLFVPGKSGDGNFAPTLQDHIECRTDYEFYTTQS